MKLERKSSLLTSSVRRSLQLTHIHPFVVTILQSMSLVVFLCFCVEVTSKLRRIVF